MTTTILLLADNPYFGGITSHILTILSAMDGHDRFSFRLATFPGWHEDETLVEQAEALGAPVHVFSMAFRFDPRVRGALRRYLERERIVLIHTHGYRGTLLAAGMGLPVVSTCHGEALEPAVRTRVWQYFALRAARTHRVVVGCSDFTSRWLARQGLSQTNIQTIHNCFAGPLANSAPALIRAEMNIGEDALVLLYVGRLAPGKGVEFLIKAAANVPKSITIIVGEGSERGRLERLAASQNHDVRFVGYQASVGPYYRLCDVVVLPSRLEALPMALIEGACYSRPAVATRAGGAMEVVADAQTGFLVDYGDVAALSAALERLCVDETRARLGGAARARWESHFSPSRMRVELEAVYTRALREEDRRAMRKNG